MDQPPATDAIPDPQVFQNRASENNSDDGDQHQYHGQIHDYQRFHQLDSDVGATPNSRRSIISADDLALPGLDPSIMDPPSSAHSASLRGAARELLGIAARRSRRSIVDVRNPSAFSSTQTISFTEDDNAQAGSESGGNITENIDSDDHEANVSLLSESQQPNAYGATSINGGDMFLDEMETDHGQDSELPMDQQIPPHSKSHHSIPKAKWHSSWVHAVIQQVSAVAVISLLNMMIAIPFGASYFPVKWRAQGDDSTNDGGDDTDLDIDGVFPLPGKVALGIRMFLFATAIGQLVGAFASKFANPIYLQMVENVPFLHALAYIVIREQGYGMDALSTLFFLFGLSSVIVGLTFYALGKLELGRVVYYFPSHVLVGCIGGIGAFIIITAVEVTNNVSVTFDMQGVRGFFDNIHLFSVVLFFEITLRVLIFATQDVGGRPKFQLLTPMFYCMITPLFYFGMLIFGVDMETAQSLGYFFPSMADGDGVITDPSSSTLPSAVWGMITDEHLLDIFKIIDVRTVSWTVVFHCTGTMIALAAFSLIHVPINIPAFAISTDVDTDMNAELIAHGYSNMASGLFGGLQNYMCYSNSVLYAKSGGTGKASSIAAALITAVLFVVGPTIASCLPRCMAGTLLLHIGVDLVLEGVYDSWGDFDYWEYAGIWVIALVMTFWGMTAALLAGVIAAMSTYAAQSMTFQNPIRQIMRATTLRSSAWNRCVSARSILNDHHTGRSRILIFQLQGHLFFGNVAQLTDSIKKTLNHQKNCDELPLVAIIDFTLVVGMDSSAAHAVQKLKKIIHRLFNVEVCIFVTGVDRGGFPCEYALTQALNADSNRVPASDQHGIHQSDAKAEHLKVDEKHKNGQASHDSSSLVTPSKLLRYSTGKVCESLDEALIFAENILVARVDPTIQNDGSVYGPTSARHSKGGFVSFALSPDEEHELAKRTMYNLFVGVESGQVDMVVKTLLSIARRAEYKYGQLIWEEGSDSNFSAMVVTGTLLSYIEGSNNSEVVYRGNFIGELGLTNGANRLSTLRCISDTAVIYIVDLEAWETIKRQNVQVAAIFYEHIVVRYLAHRVQHVSNRYFGSATLPI